MTLILLAPCSSLAIRSASSMRRVPKPWCWNLVGSRALTGTTLPYTCSSLTIDTPLCNNQLIWGYPSLHIARFGKACLLSCFVLLKFRLFFGHFEKTQGQKNSSQKKTQSNFPKNSSESFKNSIFCQLEPFLLLTKAHNFFIIVHWNLSKLKSFYLNRLKIREF